MSRADKILNEGGATDRNLNSMEVNLERALAGSNPNGVLSKQLQEEEPGLKKDIIKLNKTVKSAMSQFENIQQIYQMAYQASMNN